MAVTFFHQELTDPTLFVLEVVEQHDTFVHISRVMVTCKCSCYFLIECFNNDFYKTELAPLTLIISVFFEICNFMLILVL